MNPTPQDGGKQEQPIRTKLKPVYAELRDCSVARVYLADAVDGVLAQRDAALISSVNSIAGMREDQKRLEWLLDYITAKGTNGIKKLAWSLYDEDGESLNDRKTVTEDEVADVKFDRATIDRALTPPQENKA